MSSNKKLVLKNQDDYVSVDVINGFNLMFVGLGAVGSYAAPCVAKTGAENFFLFDADIVEGKNVNNQAFGQGEVGELKVDATKRLILESNPEASVQVFPEMLTKRKQFRAVNDKPFIIFLLVDSVEARLNIAEIASSLPNASIIIESQMGVGSCAVNVLYPNIGIPKEWLAQMEMLKGMKPTEVSGCGTPWANCSMSMITGGLVGGRHLELMREDTHVFNNIAFDPRSTMCTGDMYEEYDND